MGPPMPGGMRVNDQYKIPRPKNLKGYPEYFKKLFSTFFSRLIYIVKLVWEASPLILFIMLFMAICNGFLPVIGSIIGKDILNELAAAYNGENVLFSVIITLLIFQALYLLFNSILSRINGMVTRISGELLSNHIKLKIMRKAKDVDVASFDMPDFYAKMENANREAGMRPVEVLNSVFKIFSTIISIVSYIVILFAINWWAPLIIFAISIPSTIINYVYRKKNVNYMIFRSKERRQMNYYSELVVNKDLIKEVRMLGLTDTFCKNYEDVFQKYYKGLKQLMMREFWWTIAATLLTTGINCGLFIMLANGVFTGAYEIGNYSLYTGALTSIAAGVSTLITTTASIYEGTMFINNMIAFMKEEKHIKSTLEEPRHVTRHIAHTFEFQNVSFSYPGMERKVIKNVNIKIDAGDTVVLVGLNGAGKTTLIKLMTRLYDPTEGRILLDGYDIREYDVSELYAMFGIIFQDFGKYAFSVTDNIAFGDIDKEVDDYEIKRAARESSADQFIEKLPGGYNTPLMKYFETDGVELSTGQWQKLSVARAFYSDSDVLILDEPTASLDAIAEQEIFNQFDELRRDKTTLFVSHRLSSATTASKIIVLEDGEIVEVGNHKSLMHARGKYYNLFWTQAKRYVTNDGENGERVNDGNDTPPPYIPFDYKQGDFPPSGFGGAGQTPPSPPSGNHFPKE